MNPTHSNLIDQVYYSPMNPTKGKQRHISFELSPPPYREYLSSESSEEFSSAEHKKEMRFDPNVIKTFEFHSDKPFERYISTLSLANLAPAIRKNETIQYYKFFVRNLNQCIIHQHKVIDAFSDFLIMEKYGKYVFQKKPYRQNVISDLKDTIIDQDGSLRSKLFPDFSIDPKIANIVLPILASEAAQKLKKYYKNNLFGQTRIRIFGGNNYVAL